MIGLYEPFVSVIRAGKTSWSNEKPEANAMPDVCAFLGIRRGVADAEVGSHWNALSMWQDLRDQAYEVLKPRTATRHARAKKPMPIRAPA